ncbi:hypothetical protein PGTUg99_001824 [Puccinia graminis f. sp. tritici]|uniref:Uncharacterized protein n=1 Tax=Puccinia graminis f. sp. tritici TaxID=56615 RepID=A0A5B0NTJ2_PUCGR|nr:hypothetical protein PGTUg99_001824 [Puccinia graminis f. sp. tritici]
MSVQAGAWVANLAVRFNFHFGHSGGSGASFSNYLAKVAVHPHLGRVLPPTDASCTYESSSSYRC